MTEGEDSFELFKKYLKKRIRRRYEWLGILRYILRILMLFKRLLGADFPINLMTFAWLGVIENGLGIAK